MRQFSTCINLRGIVFIMIQCLFLTTTLTTTLSAQQTNIKDYVIFGGNGSCPGGVGVKAPLAPGCAVQLGPASNIQGGSVGSYRLVKSTGSATINANIFCGGTIQLANSNSVTGKITAANSPAVSGTILSVGSSATISGNIDVNGNIIIGGGTVSGNVTVRQEQLIRARFPGDNILLVRLHFRFSRLCPL